MFCQYYHNDTNYHKGQNQVVDPSLMNEKWIREVNYITQMRNAFSNMVPEITNIDLKDKRIYMKIQGVDFWQQTIDNNCTYEDILPDWQEQMLAIFRAHKSLGIYKYSLHPSSYFVVDGKLKSINYFFCYRDIDKTISIREVLSHISEDRQKDLFPKMLAMGIDLDSTASFKDLQMLAFESFKKDFPTELMEEAKKIYV
jgi:tRNA A-37 threonylcarbamoyl transferase component Bud32